jgi:hypothetical protein
MTEEETNQALLFEAKDERTRKGFLAMELVGME